MSDENEQLKNKLTETKDKLAEATVQIRELSLEITNFKSENTFYIGKYSIFLISNFELLLLNKIYTIPHLYFRKNTGIRKCKCIFKKPNR